MSAVDLAFPLFFSLLCVTWIILQTTFKYTFLSFSTHLIVVSISSFKLSARPRHCRIVSAHCSIFSCFVSASGGAKDNIFEWTRTHRAGMQPKNNCSVTALILSRGRERTMGWNQRQGRLFSHGIKRRSCRQGSCSRHFHRSKRWKRWMLLMRWTNHNYDEFRDGVAVT